jgi:amino acid permease
MKPKQIIAGVGIMVGMIIGSGVFALPYVVAQSGLWLGAAAATLALILAWVMHHAYAEIVLRTPQKHRLPGYIRYYLGPVFGGFETLLLLLSFHAILLSYALLAGLFASQLWLGSEYLWTTIFYALMALLLLRPAKSIGEINFVLLLPFVLMVVGVAVFGLAEGSINFIPSPSEPNIFPVFATFLFALTGYSVVPDSLSVLGAKPTVHGARKIISIATFLPFILYAPFIIGVLMLSGSYVSEDSLSGLIPSLGVAITSVGAFVGLLAVATSYLSLGFDLRNMYSYDYNISKLVSWLLVVIVPVIPYVLGYHDYIKVLSFVGGFLIAIDGVFIMLALLRARKKYPHHTRILPIGTLGSLLIAVGFFASVVYSVMVFF